MVAKPPIDHDTHEIALEGAWPVRAGARGPTLLQRKEEDFVGALLADLASERASALGLAHRPPCPNGELQLFQPIHRVFNLVLIEAHCQRFMHPRLDPLSVDSAGFVVRRLVRDAQGRTVEEAWLSAQGKALGWVALGTPDLLERDPDPLRRVPLQLTGVRELDQRLRATPDEAEEQVTRLFLAPPDIATKTHRTLFYGVIPVTSTSRAGSPKGSAQADQDPAWAQHLHQLLRASASSLTLEFGPGLLVPEDAGTFDRRPFMSALTQLRQEFQLFSNRAPAEAASVVSILNRLQITLQDDSQRPAGDYLAQASAICFDQRNDLRLQRPKRWPAVPASVAEDLERALRQCSKGVLRDLIAPEGSAGRYEEDPTARYLIRCFVRVKRPCDCPPRLIWSEPSETFTIAPWHATSPVAPVLINLPDPFDRQFLSNTKPGVAFAVPGSLGRFLNQDPKELLKGANQPSGPAIDWICGFSIPIIMICAFIVLSIFLALLNLVFFWLPLVKICIPFPRKK